MAKEVLSTDFKDDVLNESMGGRRRYTIIDNGDGTISLEDVSAYDQQGSLFGQALLNAFAKAINESLDKAVVVEELADVAAVTEAGYLPGAKSVAELNKNMGNCTFSVQSDGAYITYTPTGGADPVIKKLGNANFSFSIQVKGVAKSKANNSERYSVSGTATGSCTDGIVDFSQQFFQSSGYEWNGSADGKESIGVYVQGITITFDD